MRKAILLGGPAHGHTIDEPKTDKVMIPKMNMSWGHYDAWDFIPYKRLPAQFDDNDMARFVHSA